MADFDFVMEDYSEGEVEEEIEETVSVIEVLEEGGRRGVTYRA